MAAVTQSIPSFLGGVSTQQDTKKQPGQLTESINAFPDPTFGLTKRPGLKFIRELVGSANVSKYDDAKWFFINEVLLSNIFVQFIRSRQQLMMVFLYGISKKQEIAMQLLLLQVKQLLDKTIIHTLTLPLLLHLNQQTAMK